MRYEAAGLTVLYVLTFLIVLPVLCSTWRYSVYYRGAESTDENDPSVLSYLSDVMTSAVNDEADERPMFLLVTIVTVRREGHFYLSRVVARLHQLLSAYNGGHGNDGVVRAMICNVDRDPQLHQEALDLQTIYPVVRRDGQPAISHGDLMDKEKDDYIFCLNASRHYHDQISIKKRQSSGTYYILVLEDDAVPLDDLLPVTRRLIDYLKMRRSDDHQDFFYVKLYHPERLQNYWQPEPWRIAEWMAVSVLSVFLLQVVLGLRLRRHSLWIVYFMALTECLGRPHLLQFKRWIFARLASPAAAYNLLAATECCTPAMLFSNTSAYLASTFLSSINCKRGYAKDTALYLYARQSGRQAFVVEPNLVQHIGRVSTLRFN